MARCPESLPPFAGANRIRFDGCDLSLLRGTPVSAGYQRLHLGSAYAKVSAVQRTYTASEAARALGISLDTLRRWDRQGRIRVRRDRANRPRVPAGEIERLRGGEPHRLSARNRFEGIVSAVEVDGLLAQVELE